MSALSRPRQAAGIVGICLLAGLGTMAHAEEPNRVQVVGEAFGQLVRAEEFAYYYKTAAFFTRTGNTNRQEEEIRGEAWQNLVFLREADRLGIQVDRSELEKELQRLVADKDVRYGSPDYAPWVRANLKEDVTVFERRIADLLRIGRLLKDKMEPDVSVTKEEIEQRFLDEHNQFESEYIHFDSRKEAEDFLARLTADRSIWKKTFDAKRAELGQKGAAWVNTMTVIALNDLWKLPREDAYRIIAGEPGTFTVAGNYYGETVVRLLRKQTSGLEKLDDAATADYRENIRKAKQSQLAQAYLKELWARAQVRDYEQERRQAEQRKQQEAAIPALKEKSRIVLQTTQGGIELQLWPDAAPKACENFIGLVGKGYYDGLTFHRVIKDFMIQGGDPAGNGTGGESLWGKPFEDEVRAEVTFDRPGLLAMANSGPNTNGSQFFITTVPTAWLNGRHTIFGEVVGGMDAVKRISEVKADGSSKPLEPQKILKASIQPNSPAQE